VGALGIAGQLDGCLAVDAAGHALGPCLIWMDRRAETEAQAVDTAVLRRLTGVTRDATHMAAKIAWLKRNPPEGGPAARYHQPVSYLVARLTGAQVFDRGLASTTMLYGLARRGYEPALLDAFGIAARELPEIAEAGACAGALTAEGAALTGLPEGIPVAVGTGDDFSTPLGAGLVAPGRAVCVLGTAEVVGALDPEPRIDDRGLVETHSYAGGGFYIENPGWLSGGALAWLRALLGIADFAMAPEWVAAARGCFYGLTPAQGAGQLARAALEGCAFAMRDVVERLIALGVTVEGLLLLGGGARSRVWTQIRADCTGLPVALPALTDTSALGAAICGAVAGGMHSDIPSCAARVGGTAETVEPDLGARPAYDDAYRAYRRLFDCLRPMFESSAAAPAP
jgi:xylulokinase